MRAVDRRSFLKAAGVSAAALGLPGLARAAARAGRPNLIVIMADDISAKEFPTYGIPNPTYKDAPCATPVLARMKARGVQFKHAWASPLCHPSRGMILTGRYAHRTQWWSNEFGPVEGEKGYPLYGGHLTLGQIARKAGYATQFVGKWQLGGTRAGYAFDEYVFTPDRHAARAPADKKPTGSGKGKPSYYWNPGYSLHNHPDHAGSPDGKERTFKTTWDDFAADIELKFIQDFIRRRHGAGEPFFVYWPAHLGHSNWDFDKDRMGYPGVPRRDASGKRTGKKTPPGINYHVQYLDYCVGELIKQTVALGIEKNTLILLTTDNATTPYGKGLKGAIKEHGPKVPMIVYGPGLVKARGEVDDLASLADVAPTLAELTGARLPRGYEFDGKSLVPFLSGKADRHREWLYSYNAEYRMVRTRRVVRDGLGLYWDTRGTVDQEAYRRIRKGRAEGELARDIALIERVLEKYPAAPTSGPMYERYLKKKAGKRKRWEAVRKKFLEKNG